MSHCSRSASSGRACRSRWWVGARCSPRARAPPERSASSTNGTVWDRTTSQPRTARPASWGTSRSLQWPHSASRTERSARARSTRSTGRSRRSGVVTSA
ncbi:MAG: hypothetical protein ACKVS7_00935 [Gemmatimonadaceae bacterium]